MSRQIALDTVLTIDAALLTRTWRELHTADRGLNIDNVAPMRRSRVNPPLSIARAIAKVEEDVCLCRAESSYVQFGTAGRQSPEVPSWQLEIGEESTMNIVVVLIILLLLFGGGGFYLGGPMIGGSLGGLILLVLIVMLLTGRT